MNNRLLPLLLLLFWNCGLQAQNHLNEGHIVQNTFHDTIPFEFIQGKMVVALEIGGKLRKFILDTGAPCTVFDYLQQEIGAKVTYRDSLKDASGGISELDRIKIKSFKLGQIEFRDIPAVVLREQMGSMLKCWGVDGLIGSNALRNCILQIDLKAKRLILSSDPAKLDLSNSATVPLHLDDNQSHPFLELTLSEEHVIPALFDSGDEDAFSLSKEDSAIPLERQTARLINVGHGKMIISLTESQQEQWFRLFSYDTLTIGTTHFLNFTSIPGAEQDYSCVGIGLGAHGIITLDYLNKQFHFQSYDKKIIEGEKYSVGYGLFIYPAQDHYVIGTVWNDSPAGRLGLKSGYKIWSIEGVDFSKRTPTLDCELFIGQHTQKDVINLEYVDDQGKIIAISIAEE
jgi:hypothetical protein